MKGAALAQYVVNMSTLLTAAPARYRSGVARQVQAAILPHLTGTCAELEQPLWQLLTLCLDGDVGRLPALDEAALAAAIVRITTGKPPMCFPEAARAVWHAFTTLRTHGIYPPPHIQPAVSTSLPK